MTRLFLLLLTLLISMSGLALGENGWEIITLMRGAHSMKSLDRFHKMKILVWISPLLIAAGVLCIFSIVDKNLERKSMITALGETNSAFLERWGEADRVTVEGDFSTYQYDSHISLKRYEFIFKEGILIDRKVLYSY